MTSSAAVDVGEGEGCQLVGRKRSQVSYGVQIERKLTSSVSKKSLAFSERVSNISNFMRDTGVDEGRKKIEEP